MAHTQQTSQVGCGAAALHMWLIVANVKVSLAQLMTEANTTAAGTSLHGLEQAARRHGLPLMAVRCSYNDMLSGETGFPFIAHTVKEGFAHFLLVRAVDAEWVQLSDPADAVGPKHISRAEFQRLHTGYAAVYDPSPPDAPAAALADEPPPKEPVAASALLRELIWHEWRDIAITIVAGLLVTLFTLAGSFALQNEFDKGIPLGDPKLHLLLLVCLGWAYLGRLVVGGVREWVFCRLEPNLCHQLAPLLLRRVLEMPVAVVRAMPQGDVMAALVQDVARVSAAVVGAVVPAVIDGVQVVVSIAVLWILFRSYAGAPIALAAGVLLACVLWQRRVLARLARVEMAYEPHFPQAVADAHTAHADLVAANAQPQWLHHSMAYWKRYLSAHAKYMRSSLRPRWIAGAGTAAALVIVLHESGQAAMANGDFMFGRLVVLFSIVTQLMEPCERIAEAFGKIGEALAGLERIRDLIIVKPAEQTGSTGATFEQLSDAIRLEDVSVEYPQTGLALREVSLDLEAGKQTAIVGPSGQGKSTLLDVLVNFVSHSGQVRYDGIDLRDLDKASLRAHVAYVRQDAQLVTGTIRDNLALGAPETPLRDLMVAARTAGADEFIKRMPARYDTHLGPGGRGLSGGQRQRVALVRALRSRPDVLLLDEPTARLDVDTARRVWNGIERAMAGKTLIYATHSARLARRADRVVVVEHGRVVEEGTPKELLANRGAFYRMCHADRVRRPARLTRRQAMCVLGHGDPKPIETESRPRTGEE